MRHVIDAKKFARDWWKKLAGMILMVCVGWWKPIDAKPAVQNLPDTDIVDWRLSAARPGTNT
tara:strand:- start:1392 stop:1577 length:186 start_codon:yes stop_codon:yes gene_type:complete